MHTHNTLYVRQLRLAVYNYRSYVFDVTRPRDQADRHIEGKKCIVAIVSACLRSFRSYGKELLRCWVYKQVRERQESKLLPFSSGTEQASKMDCSSKPKKLDA